MSDSKIKSSTVPSVPRGSIRLKCIQYCGDEVLDLKTHEPIKTKEGIKPGDEVSVPSLFGRFKAKIADAGSGVLYAEDEYNIFYLSWDQDHRHCWTCDSAAYKKAVEELVNQIQFSGEKDKP